MTDTLMVLLDDVVAGHLERLPGGRLRFDYSDEYRGRAHATPLSVSMPIQVASHPDNSVRPWLSGLLPDNDAVLARWARQFQVSASPFSLLGSPVGEDCAGAVRFAPPETVDRVLTMSGQTTWLTDAEVAQRLHDLREDATAWLGRTFTGQFSLAGAQAKTALRLLDGRWGVPSGSTPTTHILKPAVAGLDDHDLNEHLCLDAARRAGLLAVRTRIAQFDSETALVIQRYDRRTVGNQVVRVHQEDLCQALGVRPARKYENEGGPRPADITKLLRHVMPPYVGEQAVWLFADALVWNWLIGATDAHAKNYSVLLAGGQVRLAPLYDIASALPYGMHEKKLRLAMKVGGSYAVHPDRNTWPRAALDLGLDPERLLVRVRDLLRRAPDAMSDAAQDSAVQGLRRALPARLVDLVSERASRCLRIVDAATERRLLDRLGEPDGVEDIEFAVPRAGEIPRPARFD